MSINDKIKKQHPSENINLFNEFYVLWLTPLIQLANERPLVIDDIYDTPHKQTTNENFQKVWKSWINEKEKYKEKA